MAAIFTFPDLTKIPWLPVKFESAYGDYITKSFPVYFYDGVYFELNESLKNFKDISFNKKTGFFLSNLTKADNILEPSTPPEDSFKLQRIETPVSFVDVNYDKIIAVAPFSNSYVLSATYRAAPSDTGLEGYPSNFGPNDTLTFEFITDTLSNIEDAEKEFVQVSTSETTKATQESPHKLYLTWSESFTLINGVKHYDVTFSPQIFPESYTQRFAYLLSDDGIYLFKPNSDYFYILTRDESTLKYNLREYFPINVYLPNQNIKQQSALPTYAFFKFISYKNQHLDIKRVKNSFLAKYIVNKLDYQQELVLDPEVSSLEYFQNFLGIFAVESPKMEKDVAIYKANIHGLKNYQTPEYNYSLSKHYEDQLHGVRRQYDKVFSGTQQSGGLNNVYLGYQANTSKLVLPKDKETLFNFSPVAIRLPLSASGLIEDGAIAGHHPFIADRIYLKQIDYSQKILGLPQPPSVYRHTNTWLCAWLSGSTSGEKTWMDRFYNAAYYTVDQALSAQTIVYNDKIDPLKDYIFDVPSTMFLEPGAFYKYYHGGLETSKNYINFLDGVVNSPYGSKILAISSWDTSPLLDSSGYHNNGLIYSESNVVQNNPNYWVLDGTNHAAFPSKTLLLEQHQFTTSLWINVDNWSDIQGRQVFGNYYDSGYGLVNDASVIAPLWTITDKVSGGIYSFNYQFKTTSFISLPILNTSEIITMRLPDLSSWVFDVTTGTGYKVDVDGKLLNLSDKIYDVTQIISDENLNLYLFQLNRKTVSVLDSNGKFKSSFKVSSNLVKRIEYFNYKKLGTSNIIQIYGNCSVIDQLNNVWQIIGANLYKSSYDPVNNKHLDPTIFASIGKAQQITCDAANNLWICHGDDISKIDPSGNITNVTIGKRVGLDPDPCIITKRHRYINFVRSPEAGSYDCFKYKYKDLAIVIDTRDNEAYLLDVNMDLISKLDTSTLLNLNINNFNFTAEGDFTGYQHLRRFVSSNKNLCWKLKIAEPNGNYAQNLTLTYNSDSLRAGWHHFALVFDALKGEVVYYIDAIPVDREFVPYKSQLYFKHRSSLLLGADSIKNGVLNDIINVQNGYKFIGKVANLTIYNKSLNQGDIEQLYFASDFTDNKKDLIWNIPTGNRNYIEEVRHWFQMQMPGSKSKYFNINIHNLKVSNEMKNIIESAIKSNVYKIVPAHTSLFRVNWF